MFKKSGRLTKISDNSNDLRSNGVSGDFMVLPSVGERFNLVSDALVLGAGERVISTSPVLSIEEAQSGMVFKTMNSIYLLEIFLSQK